MSAMSWSVPGALAPASAYRRGDRVWMSVPGDSLPAVVIRSGPTQVQVVYYRAPRGLRPSGRYRRWVGSDVLCMRHTTALIDRSRRAGNAGVSR